MKPTKPASLGFRVTMRLGQLALVGLFANVTVTWLATRALLDEDFLARLEQNAAAELDAELSETPTPAVLRQSDTSRRQMAETLAASGVFCPTCGDDDQNSPDAETEQAVEPSEGLIASQLPLQLVATMEADDPGASIAVLASTTSGASGSYGVDESITANAVLVAVQRTRVILRNGQQLEYLALAGTETLPRAKPKIPSVRAIKPRTPRAVDRPPELDEIKCSGDDCEITTKLRDQLLANPASLSREARMSPAKKDGVMYGYKVLRLKSSGLLAGLGLKKSDVITAINGQELTNLDSVLALYQKARRASHVTFTLERGGKLLDKRVRVVQKTS